jgi:TolB protein
VAWKAALAIALLALIILGGLAVARRLGPNPRPAVAQTVRTEAAPAPRPAKGTIVFQSRVGGFWQIFSLDLSSAVRTRLTRVPADDITPSVSPDGSWILFQSSRSGTADIWRMRRDGTAVERLTDVRFDCFDPCWGGGGSFILYSSRRSGRENIFAMDLGTRREQQLTDSFWSSILPSMSFDDSTIVFARNKLGWDVYRMDGDGTNVVALTNRGGNCRPDWSPDGKRVAYVSDVADGKGDVWTMDAGGGNKMRITPGYESYDYNPAWSPDGRWLVYETTTGSKDNPWSLAIIPAAGGTPTLLSPAGANDRFPDWAPGQDGR